MLSKYPGMLFSKRSTRSARDGVRSPSRRATTAFNSEWHVRWFSNPWINYRCTIKKLLVFDVYDVFADYYCVWCMIIMLCVVVGVQNILL